MAKISKSRRNELIKIKLSAILQKSASDPRFEGVTVVNVKLAPDFSTAVIYYSIYHSHVDIDDLTELLNGAAGFFQSKLAKALQTKTVPKLTFVYDSGFDYSDNIESILKRMKKESAP